MLFDCIPFRKQVASHNLERLIDLQKPVLRVEVANHGAGAAQMDEEEAGGLFNTLYLAIDARVMLTRNLWTKEGLVNGTMGTVHSILWDNGVQDLLLRLPVMVMVEFDDYEGVGCVDVEGRRVDSHCYHYEHFRGQQRYLSSNSASFEARFCHHRSQKPGTHAAQSRDLSATQGRSNYERLCGFVQGSRRL